MNYLIAVTGSIACYRALDIMRGILKASPKNKVRIILSKGAENFLKPEIFRYLGAEKVYRAQDDFNIELLPIDQNVLHISLARWCHYFCVLPATANTLARLAWGMADDLLCSSFLSLEPSVKKIIFPVMNPMMLSHPHTTQNLKKLEELENTFVFPPDSGEMICGEMGQGKMAPIEAIVDFLDSIPQLALSPKARYVLISTGASISPLDPVRYLTNPSTGLTGFYLSQAFLKKGYRVTVVASTTTHTRLNHLLPIPGYSLIRAQTTKEMKSHIDREFPLCNLYISSAAFCDIEFPFNENKVKKKQLLHSLDIKQSPDILKSLLQRREHQKIVGFGAEATLDKMSFNEKIHDKPVDFFVGNAVSNGYLRKKEGFGETVNEYFLKDTHSGREEISQLNKPSLANKIVDWYEENIDEQHRIN
ncbi:MAG: bifunctional phosphopantothenoylcysteine decarboxylase/phosphopantothenate--cysteine ligase CoaBC [Halobacteriovoraceae bacterium]|nr:bifunctional phosphopantothenoylcysteine decarboxylase/phosphopantothenate--cysteine ligase CoaBC [Halobacteriovoraceae bacterium]MCB9095651.1 bifunctional phosphopantothenoylcysteine decarboxylase/phosphopantothenate--cysteine ligase CoaBC [Halobacteriovoraceae bacterium]